MIPTPTLAQEQADAWRPTLEGLGDADILQFYHAVAPHLRADAVCVEIGVWRGRSLLFLAELLAALGKPRAKVYGVDPYRFPPIAGDLEGCTVSYREALVDLVGHGSTQELSHIHLLRARSAEASQLFRRRSCDLVFIDGDHSRQGCYDDIQTWKKRIRRGGILAGHDFGPDHPGVVEAVGLVYGSNYDLYGTVWVAKGG